MRGSRKHLLDLVTDRPGELATLLEDTGFTLRQPSAVRPRSREQPSEYTLRQFCREYLPEWRGFESFDKWWVPEEYTNPTWDLLALGEQGRRPGLLLVEAKAHEGELEWKGKCLAGGASAQSVQNHADIAKAISWAAGGLSKALGQPVGVAHQTHYQLSNRIASAYALASAGLPVVLLYLGFSGDTYFKDYLADDEGWQRAMRGYLKDIVPDDFIGKRIAVGGGSMMMIVKSLAVASVSKRDEAVATTNATWET